MNSSGVKLRIYVGTHNTVAPQVALAFVEQTYKNVPPPPHILAQKRPPIGLASKGRLPPMR